MKLSYSRQAYIEAIDREQKKVLLGGLGALGVGSMWVSYDDESKFKDYPGYKANIERKYEPGFPIPYNKESFGKMVEAYYEKGK